MRIDYPAKVQESGARSASPATAVVIRLEGWRGCREEVGPAAPVDALAAAAGAIAAHVRQGDELGRWSDDELAVLCPGADPDAVTQLAHRLVAAIEDVRVRHFLTTTWRSRFPCGSRRASSRPRRPRRRAYKSPRSKRIQ